MQDTYYYCASTGLAKGSIIQPGNWGRILYMYGGQYPGNWEVLYREMCLEYIRKLEFTEKPSRLDSIFLCRTKKGMDSFRKKNNRLIDIAYKVKILDNKKPIHIANWSQVSPPNWGQQNSIIKSMEESARSYWKGLGSDSDNKEDIECVVESCVEVIESYT